MRRGASLLAGLLLAGTALGQSNSNFRLEEHAFNGGGAPVQGQQLSSASFRITLASVGDRVVASGLNSNLFRLDAGFAAAFPPPGEVAGACGPVGSCLVFTGTETLTWPAERSVGTYNLYRDAVGSEFGVCAQSGLTAAAASDADVPPPGEAFFYLVTAANRLGEEGTRGFSRIGVTTIERAGTPCP